MQKKLHFDYQNYLQAKKSIDDKSLNTHVWNSLSKALIAYPSSTSLRVLELGVGIGSMVQRVIERGIITNAYYKGIDIDPTNAVESLIRLKEWARTKGLQTQIGEGSSLIISGNGIHLTVVIETGNAIEVMKASEDANSWDLVIAQAFLDLVNLEETLPLILNRLKSQSLAYLCINFDGTTTLEPFVNRRIDRQIEKLYHQSMDKRSDQTETCGSSLSGRTALRDLRSLGAEIVDAGASDWVVFPSSTGYLEDEEYFLHYIINTIYQELITEGTLDPAVIESWKEVRQGQIKSRELFYITHQLDILARTG